VKDDLDLLQAARELLHRSDAATAGLWPRAAALLTRQALEAALDAWWEEQGIPMGACSMRARLICLRERAGDARLGARLHHAWGALSRACHHHPYELPPTAAELENWMRVVDEFRGGA